jgi:2-hydroxychromene-2-carboxylate isomerase
VVRGEVKALCAVISELGNDADAVFAAANSDATVDGLAAETEAASHLGVFGSPTFVAGSEIFWGDDRLEDALEWVTGQHELIG